MKLTIHKTVLFPVIMGLVVSACGAEFAYKRGANRDDLESSKKACATQAGDASAMEKCLEGHGWVMQNFNEADNELDPVIDVSVSDNRGYGAPVAGKSTGATNAGKPISKEASGEAAMPAQAKTSVTKEADSAIAAAPSAFKKPADPMDTFKVSSWWKLGSGPEGLKPAITECIATLGEAHKPDEKTHLVTRGLLVCMAGKGWRGLREK